MNIGDRVKVTQSVTVYHHPQHRTEPFDIQGLEGELMEIVTQWKGRPVSANYPYLVKFEVKSDNKKPKKFQAHFQEHELEVT